jgi:hypothetical protein
MTLQQNESISEGEKHTTSKATGEQSDQKNGKTVTEARRASLSTSKLN